MNQRLLACAISALALPVSLAQAARPIPEETGWSGHVNIGAGVGQSESNMIAAISSIDLGDDTVENLLDSPDDEDVAMPTFQFEVAYTLGDSKTQFYLGNQVVDFVSFDLETTLEGHAGIRQKVEGIGTVDVSLTTSTLPTDVWKDPYIANSPRSETERTSAGLQMIWSGIMDTPLNIEFASTEIEIDDEDSGEALGLTPVDQRALRREGQIYRYVLEYEWQINDQHRLVPSIGYHDYELDGDAMAADGFSLGVVHNYQRERWRFVSKLFYRSLESDETNPIYDVRDEADVIGAVFTAFYAKPFGWESWTANATLSYTESDNDIDFYDSSFGMVAIGMLYRFD